MRVLSAGIAVQAFDHRLGLLALHAAPLDQEVHGLLVGSDDAGKASNFRRHVGHGGTLVDAQRFNRLTRILHDLGQRFATAHVIQAENFQDEIFCGHVGMLLAANHDSHRLGNLHPHIFRDP